ncbi:MAG TPA: sensor histidine kinase [Propionibacteriaceae bacterium]|nr:sensor histidine kinase [Propionibacteriaceae bacterium]
MRRAAALLRRYGFDVLIVIAAIEMALETALRYGAPSGPTTPTWFAVPASALIALPLLARRRFPFAAPVAVWVLAAALSFVDGRLVGFTNTASIIGLAAAFLLGNLRDSAQARVGLVIAVGGAATVMYNSPTHTTGALVIFPTTFLIAWLGGFALRQRSAQAEEAEDRAARAERERVAAARIAVAEERARIARELHDVVAHAVSVMVLQVGAVRHRLPHSLTEDRDALIDVEKAGRAALAEMRRLLGAMHDGQDPELAPQPGLDSLDALVERVGRAGLPVRLKVEGDVVPLPRAVDLSAYRIVQEGLTNSLKHAKASGADVTVRYRSEDLELEVRDDGVGASTSDGLGHGLVGVKERVKIYGGEMSAGPGQEGGFVLNARLPIEGHRP